MQSEIRGNRITILYGNCFTIIYGKIYAVFSAFSDCLKSINKNHHILSIYLSINDSKTPKKHNTNTPKPSKHSFRLKKGGGLLF